MRSPPLVGRNEQLAVLTAALQSVRNQQPTLVLVEGESGIGKTALVSSALFDGGEAADHQVTGQASPLTADIPYGLMAAVIRDIIREIGWTHVEQAVGASAAVVGSFAPELLPVRFQPDAGQLHDAVVSLVKRLSRNSLLWIRLEDLQWADAGTCEPRRH